MRLRNLLILVAVLIAAIAVYFVTRPAEEPPIEIDPRPRVWDYELEELKRIVIELPGQDMRESFIKHEDQQWYFDYPSGPMADPDRWSGIPFVLSGPYMDRAIAEDLTEEELANFGFIPPQMTITFTTEDGEITNIEVGDSNTSGDAYFIRLAESNDVYTINSDWYKVFENLVLDPPYPPTEEE